MKFHSPFSNENRSKFSSFGAMSLKEACLRKPIEKMPRSQANYLSYIDSMQESLNKEISDNIAPYWRNHHSLKGKLSFF